MHQLTSSSLAVFRECPRKYMHSYLLNRKRITESAPRQFGKLMHDALEGWWTGGLGAALSVLKQNAGNIVPGHAAMAAAMLSRYEPTLNCRPVRDAFKVVAVEKEFHDVRIVNPDTGRPMTNYALAGKVDALVEDEQGRLWVVEHKTTSDEILGFGPYWQRLSIDQQISYYILAVGAHGVLYDVLRKPGLRMGSVDTLDEGGLKIVLDAQGQRVMTKQGKPRQTADKERGYALVSRPETEDEYQARLEAAIAVEPDAFYQLREVPKTKDDLVEAQADMWAQAHMLAECSAANRWPRNSGACRGFFGTCEYLDVCTGRASIGDDTIFRTKEGANEELMEVA